MYGSFHKSRISSCIMLMVSKVFNLNYLQLTQKGNFNLNVLYWLINRYLEFLLDFSLWKSQPANNIIENMIIIVSSISFFLMKSVKLNILNCSVNNIICNMNYKKE